MHVRRPFLLPLDFRLHAIQTRVENVNEEEDVEEKVKLKFSDGRTESANINRLTSMQLQSSAI